MIANFAHELHPEDYYMQNPDTDEWDIEVELETGYPAGTAVLWRRAKWITQPYVPGPDPDDPITGEIPEESVSGYQYVQASPDTIAVYTGEFRHTVTAIYQQWVHAEVWNETFQFWERPQPIAKYSQEIYDPNETDRLLGVEYTADFGDGSQLKTIINYNWFTGNVNKHSYEFYGPGLRKRIYTQLQIYDPNRFNMDLSDFDGPYEVIEQAGLTNVIYYPDGVDTASCIVDPYLGVDEQSSYIAVDMDGITAWVHFARNDGSSDWIEFFEGGTERVKSRSNLPTNNAHTIASYNTAIVLENGPNRVLIRINGNWKRASQDQDLGGSTSIECYLYFYNDIILYDLIWVVGSSIEVQSNDYSSFIGMHQNSVSGEIAIYEETGLELTITGGNDADMFGDYVGLRSNEINGAVTLISDTTGVVTQRRQPKSTDGGSVCVNNKTVPAGNHRIVAAMLVDARDRVNDGGTFNAWSAGTTYAKDEIVISNNIRWISRQDGNIGNTPPGTGGSSVWWREYRIHFGEQYNDFVLTNLEDIITGLTIPISVGAGGFASDGAFHSEPRAADGKSVLTYDIDRIKPKHVLHNFPLQYGSLASPTVVTIGQTEPYGSIFVGNGTVDPLLAHADVTMHSVDGVSAEIGGDITDINNIDEQIGSVSLWCDAVAGDVWSAGTQNFKVLYNGSAFEFQYGGVLPRTVVSQPVSGPDHYVRAGWDVAADIMYIEVNGIRAQTDQLQSVTLAGSITWSGSVNRRRLFITNDLSTPENWTSNENPLHLPLVDAL